MYLSRVEIDINNRRKMRDLSHLGAYHGWIEDSFPSEREKAKKDRTRKLWRVDKVGENYYLLVLSQIKPDIEKFEKYGLEGSARIKSYDQFLENLKEGDRARFRIKLNTVKSKSDRENYPKRGRLVPLGLDELNSFLIDKAKTNGFAIDEYQFSIVERNEEYFIHSDKNEDKKTRQKIISATYEGMLKITDLEKFKRALVSGIGKKKAYGCGFLTIIPEP